MGKSNSANTTPPFVQNANAGAPADKKAAVNEEMEGVNQSSDGLSEEVIEATPAEAETAIDEATALEPAPTGDAEVAATSDVTTGDGTVLEAAIDTAASALSAIEADEAAMSAAANSEHNESNMVKAEAVAVADDDSAGGVSEVAAAPQTEEVVAENATEVRADSTFLSGINIAI